MRWPLTDVIAFAVLIAALLSVALITTRRSRRHKRRSRRAVRGEETAARLLKAHGFTILDNQAVHAFPVVADGDREDYEIRADFLVKRGGRVFVAEVKTGNLAPNLSHGPTRRQLLEYALAYDAEGVLLVTPGDGQIQRIQFPRLRAHGRRGRARMFLLGVGVGALGAWVALGAGGMGPDLGGSLGGCAGRLGTWLGIGAGGIP